MDRITEEWKLRSLGVFIPSTLIKRPSRPLRELLRGRLDWIGIGSELRSCSSETNSVTLQRLPPRFILYYTREAAQGVFQSPNQQSRQTARWSAASAAPRAASYSVSRQVNPQYGTKEKVKCLWWTIQLVLSVRAETQWDGAPARRYYIKWDCHQYTDATKGRVNSISQGRKVKFESCTFLYGTARPTNFVPPSNLQLWIHCL